MAKVERPLFSDEATGKVGMVVSFKKGAVWDSIVPQFYRKKSESKESISIRTGFEICTKVWRSLNVEDKKYFNDNAPEFWTGYQYFMQICIEKGKAMFDPNPHSATHERGGTDEIFPSGKLSIRPSLDLATVGQKEKPTIVTIGTFRCFSLPIWSDPVNLDEELFYETRLPYRWDGKSDINIPFQVALEENEDVGKKFRMQLAWEHDSCNGIIPATSNIVEVEIEILAGRNSQHDTYCLDFVIDYDIDGEGNEIKVAALLAGRLRRVAASSNEIANEVLIRHHVEVEQTIDKFFGLW
ncbi:hypothetical protein ES708_03726 [subsurface metagenome]